MAKTCRHRVQSGKHSAGQLSAIPTQVLVHGKPANLLYGDCNSIESAQYFCALYSRPKPLNSEQERNISWLVVHVGLSCLEVALPLWTVPSCRATLHSLNVVELCAYVNALRNVVCRNGIIPTSRFDAWRRRRIFFPPIGRRWACGVEDVAANIIGILVL